MSVKYKINYTLLNNNIDSPTFMPYSDHEKLDSDEKKLNPLYCPDMYPYLCNANSNAGNICRHKKEHCNKVLKDELYKNPLIYKMK
tara:strand:- start:33 stop:290 length:258 start_codon:yes stop_codon:yes gene_type:complete